MGVVLDFPPTKKSVSEDNDSRVYTHELLRGQLAKAIRSLDTFLVVPQLELDERGSGLYLGVGIDDLIARAKMKDIDMQPQRLALWHWPFGKVVPRDVLLEVIKLTNTVPAEIQDLLGFVCQRRDLADDSKDPICALGTMVFDDEERMFSPAYVSVMQPMLYMQFAGLFNQRHQLLLRVREE